MKNEPIPLLVLYITTAGVFFLLDLLWLGFAAKELYARHFGHLMREQVNWPAAVLFYLIYIGGIQIFVLVPALEAGSGLSTVLLKGALLGFFAYCTFELTGLALFKAWPSAIVWIDIAWGTLLTGGTAGAVYWLARTLLKH